MGGAITTRTWMVTLSRFANEMQGQDFPSSIFFNTLSVTRSEINAVTIHSSKIQLGMSGGRRSGRVSQTGDYCIYTCTSYIHVHVHVPLHNITHTRCQGETETAIEPIHLMATHHPPAEQGTVLTVAVDVQLPLLTLHTLLRVQSRLLGLSKHILRTLQ